MITELPREPKTVQRMTRSKIQIISHYDPEKVQDRYDRFVNYILSYGGRVNGCKFTTTTINYEGPNNTYSVCIFYEVPFNVTDQILAKAYEVQKSK